MRLEPRFSKRFATLLMIIHGGAILLLLPLELSLPIELALTFKSSLGLLVLASALHTTHRHLLLIDHPLYGCVLEYNEVERDLWVTIESGAKVRIASGSFSHPQLIVLRVEGQTGALIIFPDALNVLTFRRLRVYLRHAL